MRNLTEIRRGNGDFKVLREENKFNTWYIVPGSETDLERIKLIILREHIDMTLDPEFSKVGNTGTIQDILDILKDLQFVLISPLDEKSIGEDENDML